ncbi:hypothetical protein CDEST_09820 [Colletotrichum destructivum]|nr:hypothetical protein CDEST_09820 [Colletotrichum destructivum]
MAKPTKEVLHHSANSTHLHHPHHTFRDILSHRPFIIKPAEMEQFGVAAAHSGAINHVHAIHFGPAAVDVVREVRLAVTVVVIGWVAVTGIRTYFDRGRR